MKKIELNVNERLVLITILPEKENFITMKKVSDLKKDLLDINDEDQKSLSMRFVNGQAYWDSKVGEKMNKEFEIGEILEELIVSKLKEMNKKKELTESLIPVYEKMIGSE